MPSGRQATPGLFPHPRPPGEGSDPTPPPTTTILYLQGVPKLMAPPSSCNNKKTRKVLFMVACLMKLPHFSTQALTCSGIPDIRLSSTFAEMLRRPSEHFIREWLLKSDGPSCWPCPGRSPTGFRWATGLGCCLVTLPSPKRQGSCPDTNAGSWQRCELRLRHAEKRPSTCRAEVS